MMPLIPFIRPNKTIHRLQRDQQLRRKRVDNNNPGAIRTAVAVQLLTVLSLLVFGVVNVLFFHNMLFTSDEKSKSAVTNRYQHHQHQHNSANTCALRRYPPHRYYGLALPLSQQPDFLTTPTEYIYGEWPVVLSSTALQQLQKQQLQLQQSDRDAAATMVATKICVDQTSWWTPSSNPASSSSSSLPFADGTNPSILTLRHIQQWAPGQASWIRRQYLNAYYVATACMTNSQCAWNDSPEQQTEFRISTQNQPDTVRTVLLLLNEQGQTLAQSTIQLRLDGPWGRKFRGGSSETKRRHIMPALDDARLFLFGGMIYVSYREGPSFGYETQVLNPIHLERSQDTTTAGHSFDATLHASESIAVRGGRNMALLVEFNNNSIKEQQQQQLLKALTWVDPVTVVDVDTTPEVQKKKGGQHRLLLSSNNNNSTAGGKKSHIHGTNAFMVPIPVDLPQNNINSSMTTFLGIAHFHRPFDRNPNPYARFGHHYTHAFYTVRQQQSRELASSSKLSYELTSLSSEFLLPSVYRDGEAEIIQFMSGLEYDETKDAIVIAYGINDCEGALVTINWKRIRALLRPVERGKQVVDYMRPLSNNV